MFFHALCGVVHHFASNDVPSRIIGTLTMLFRVPCVCIELNFSLIAKYSGKYGILTFKSGFSRDVTAIQFTGTIFADKTSQPPDQHSQ